MLPLCQAVRNSIFLISKKLTSEKLVIPSMDVSPMWFMLVANDIPPLDADDVIGSCADVVDVIGISACSSSHCRRALS